VKLQAKSLKSMETPPYSSLSGTLWMVVASAACTFHPAGTWGQGRGSRRHGFMGEAHITAVWLRQWQIVVGNDHQDKVQPTAHRPGAAGDSVHALLQVERCSNIRAQHLSYAPNVLRPT
jgi:hypothetical protein